MPKLKCVNEDDELSQWVKFIKAESRDALEAMAKINTKERAEYLFHEMVLMMRLACLRKLWRSTKYLRFHTIKVLLDRIGESTISMPGEYLLCCDMYSINVRATDVFKKAIYP